MNAFTLRRLASDHSSLHKADLPPNYLFPLSDSGSTTPDDLTQLDVLLTGPQGTPYANGVWRLRLKIPEDYPKNPPKAAFQTRIWHPNVEESTGSVCVDTLKRDWESKLTLRDVLITISCLLIYPNPDSALNATAGHLLQDDYGDFARQARLMTSIHARIPPELQAAVLEAKRRGEVVDSKAGEGLEYEAAMRNQSPTPASGTARKRQRPVDSQDHYAFGMQTMPSSRRRVRPAEEFDADYENEASASKENDPSQSPSPVTMPSPRQPSQTKCPLGELPTPTELDFEEARTSALNSSERNIANNATPLSTSSFTNGLRDRDPSRTFNFTGRGLQDAGIEGLAIIDNGYSHHQATAKRVCFREEKENLCEPQGFYDISEPTRSIQFKDGAAAKAGFIHASAAVTKARSNIATKGSGLSTGRKPRIGLRRL